MKNLNRTQLTTILVITALFIFLVIAIFFQQNNQSNELSEIIETGIISNEDDDSIEISFPESLEDDTKIEIQQEIERITDKKVSVVEEYPASDQAIEDFINADQDGEYLLIQQLLDEEGNEDVHNGPIVE